MIRYFTFAFVLFAMASTTTHAQQGNLPVPKQKLPSYPPVVCVTPNWTPESCASRAPTYGPQNELSGWQCGNVRVIMSSDSTTFSMEFLITGTEQRDNRFKLVKGELYLNGRLCTSFPEHNKTESLPPYPPVTCLKPDGASEPCENRDASPAHEQNSGWAGASPNATSAPPFACMKSDGTPIHCASYIQVGVCVLKTMERQTRWNRVQTDMPIYCRYSMEERITRLEHTSRNLINSMSLRLPAGTICHLKNMTFHIRDAYASSK